jgi:exodeoxyribonuclease VII small subunit
MKKPKGATDFEAALAELEKIVEELEGDVKLERALDLFKRGIKLSTDCKKVLQAAQQEVLVLKELADGSVTTEPLSQVQQSQEIKVVEITETS